MKVTGVTVDGVVIEVEVADDYSIPGYRKFEAGSTISLGEYVDAKKYDYRVYDSECPYELAHTKHWCGYERCPEG